MHIITLNYTVMRFSDFEQKILSEIELAADLTNEVVARRLSVRSERVARSRQRMIEAGKIRPRVFINSAALGFFDLKLFFSISTGSDTKKRAIFQKITQSPGVSWLGSYAGDYRYGLAYFCKDPLELLAFTDAIGTQFPGVFSARTTLIRATYRAYARAWLGRSSTKRKSFTLTKTKEQYVPDALDRQILWHMGGSEYTSTRNLARTLGEVASTVNRRISKLEEAGVIQGYYYALDPNDLDVETYRLLLNFSSLDSALREKVHLFSRTHQQSLYLLESVGTWDFELGFETRRAREINQIISDLYVQCGTHLQDIKVLTELEELHSHYFPFVPTRAKRGV